MVSCIDSRVIMTRIVQSNVGDMLLVRNAGNVVPHRDILQGDAVSTEVAALELGCVVNNIRHVVVCGHSDCKVNTSCPVMDTSLSYPNRDCQWGANLFIFQSVPTQSLFSLVG